MFDAGAIRGAVVMDLSAWTPRVSQVRADAQGTSTTLRAELAAASKEATAAVTAVATSLAEAAKAAGVTARQSTDAATAVRGMATADREAAAAKVELARASQQAATAYRGEQQTIADFVRQQRAAFEYSTPTAARPRGSLDLRAQLIGTRTVDDQAVRDLIAARIRMMREEARAARVQDAAEAYLFGPQSAVAVGGGALAGSAMAAAGNLRASASAADNAARAARNYGFIAQQAGFQIGDMATQIAAGTAATRAITLQLPQFLGAFGPWGAVIGAATATIGALVVGLSDTREEMGLLGKAGEQVRRVADDIRQSFDAGVEAQRRLKTEVEILRLPAGTRDRAAIGINAAAEEQALRDAARKADEQRRQESSESLKSLREQLGERTRAQEAAQARFDRVRNAASPEAAQEAREATKALAEATAKTQETRAALDALESKLNTAQKTDAEAAAKQIALIREAAELREADAAEKERQSATGQQVQLAEQRWEYRITAERAAANARGAELLQLQRELGRRLAEAESFDQREWVKLIFQARERELRAGWAKEDRERQQRSAEQARELIADVRAAERRALEAQDRTNIRDDASKAARPKSIDAKASPAQRRAAAAALSAEFRARRLAASRRGDRVALAAIRREQAEALRDARGDNRAASRKRLVSGRGLGAVAATRLGKSDLGRKSGSFRKGDVVRSTIGRLVEGAANVNVNVPPIDQGRLAAAIGQQVGATLATLVNGRITAIEQAAAAALRQAQAAAAAAAVGGGLR
jgi:hypothetical protein